ncbi:unnamed protein product [Symbiodinium natans]|uniref:Uncharacterized protein n=1 Tax=Symbiodinium natans TaxID=878477 RepID=A0A812KR79_9DINO|nr:unnamed protein product [Symbiodinium natans]
MVLLEAFGLASAEIFQYNRENFQFDNEQRISKDVQKYKMQVERFELFREDIEDLVKLTVDKMDMYHLVSAVVLGFTTSVFTEGRIWGETPPSYIAVYFMTVGSGWLYLLMTVWLSMYASISSHSLGVRLRTRYVRLPIPSLQQLYGISSSLQDFEQQGMQKMFRLPFGPQGTPQWDRMNRVPGAAAGAEESQQSQAASSQAPPGPVGPPVPLAPGAAGSAGPGDRMLRRAGSLSSTGSEDLLGLGEAGFGREQVLERAVETAAPAQHVQMFRKLQSMWQCFDAYARVSMSLGVHQIVQAINLFVLGLTLVETHCPSVAIAVTLALQAVAFSLSFMDVASLKRWQWGCMLVISSGCSVSTLISLMFAKLSEEHMPDITKPFPLAPIGFWFQVVYFQLILELARPTDEVMSLPRRFRAVLFLDVFGDSSYDPTDAEHALPPDPWRPGASQRMAQDKILAACDNFSTMAQMALRRWEALPEPYLNEEDQVALEQYRKEYTLSRKALMAHLVELKREQGVPFDAEERDRIELKTWDELNDLEKGEDVFAGYVIGPMQVAAGKSQIYFYDLESGECIYDRVGRRPLLSLDDVAGHVGSFVQAVRRVFSDAQQAVDESEDGESLNTRGASPGPSAGGLEPEGNRGRSIQRRVTRSMTKLMGQTRLPTQVDNLPWKALQRLTQVLQLCWIFLAIAEGCSNWFPETFGADLFRVSWSGEEEEEKGPYHGESEEKYEHDEHEKEIEAEGHHAGHHGEHAEGEAEHGSVPAGEHEPAHAEGLPDGLPAQEYSPAGEHSSPYGSGHPISYEGELAPVPEGTASLEGGVGRLRRLRSEAPRRSPWWQRPTEVKSMWPHGMFFRALALAGLPGRGLLATTAFTLYQSSEPGLGQSPLTWEALPRPQFPASAAICDEASGNSSQDASSHCLMLAPRTGLPLLAFWPFGSPEAAVELPLSPRLPSWTTAAGAVLPCRDLQSLGPVEAPRCLLLVGWDAARLRVAVVKLPDEGLRPAPDAQVAVRSEVPLSAAGCGAAPDALHVEATGRLWLAETGALAAWHLPSGAFLGRWQPSWGAFRPSSLCVRRGRLLVAGAAGSGTFGRPTLLSFRPNFTESHSSTAQVGYK